MLKKVHNHHKFMLRYSRTFVREISRPAILFIFFLWITTTALSTFGFYYLEFGSNEKITCLFDSLYYSITLISGVGLGDIVPHTLGGKWVSMLVMLVGTGLYASFTAVTAATLLSIEARTTINPEQ